MIPTNFRATAAAIGRPSRTWLYVINWDLDHPGGVNEVVRNLFDLTSKRLHHDPLLLVRSWPQPKPELSVLDGRRTVHASWPSPWSTSTALRNLTSMLFRLPRAFIQLRRLITAENVTTINVHYVGLDAYIWTLVRATLARRPRLILSFHGLDLKAASTATGIARISWRRLLGAADHLVVCADPMRLSLIRAFPEAVEKIRVIENGVDTAAIQSSAALAPASTLPRSYVFSAGTYEAKKGHDVLIRAFDSIAPEFPNLSLVIAGRYDAAEFSKLDALRRALPSAARVLLIKGLAHDEAMRVMARADCFVLASREEPFGIAVLEAGALGLPSITTTACGALAHLRVGVDLTVVPPDDFAALGEAMATLLRDRTSARQMGARLRAAVIARLEWSRVVGAYVLLLGGDAAAD